MDKLEHYRQCIEKLLLEYGKSAPVNGEIEVEVVFDKERDRYLIPNPLLLPPLCRTTEERLKSRLHKQRPPARSVRIRGVVNPDLV